MASAVFASSMDYLVAFDDGSVRQSNFFFFNGSYPTCSIKTANSFSFGNEFLSQIEVKGEGSGTHFKLVNDSK